MNKVLSYIGFAEKSGNLVKGVDQIVENKKNVNIVLYSSLSENSASRLLKFTASKNIEAIKVLEELMPAGCKAVAVADPNLARAIKEKLKKVEDC